MSRAEPTTEAEIAEAVRAAASAKTPVRILGGGTRADLGRPVQPALALSVAGHSGVTLYDPGALTLVAKAGTPVAEIEALLATENQQLAFEPMDHRGLLGSTGEPTIGGVIAANISGPRRVQAGAARDFVLGVRLATGAGEVIKNGGRVMKNVTGLDLAKLATGSYGTLGVLTEISLKVLPKPEAAATLVFEGVKMAEGAALLRAALGSPFEVTGAALTAQGACLRVEGLESQVSHRLAQLRALLGPHQAAELTGEAHETLWRDIRDVTGFHGGDETVWRLSLRPTDAPAVAEALAALGAECQLDWGGGLIWAKVPEHAAQKVRPALAPHGGHATLVRAPAPLRAAMEVFQPEAARVAALSQALRAQFDPAGILNPGLMAA